jgi:hypothetical protein
MSVVLESHGVCVVDCIVSTIDRGCRCFLVVASVLSSLVSYCLLVSVVECYRVNLDLLGESSLSLSDVLRMVLGQRGSRRCVSGRDSSLIA